MWSHPVSPFGRIRLWDLLNFGINAYGHKFMKYPKLLGSSVDPAQLSLTIKGVLLGLIPLAIAVAKLSGVTLLEGDLVNLIEAVFAVVAGIITTVGAVRKVLMAEAKKPE